jgi:hypothetical protein
MDLVFDERLANSSFVEVIWHTHSERAGSFTSVAVSNWEMVITTFNGKTMITARSPSKGLRWHVGALFFSEYSAYIRRIQRADERTRTADLEPLYECAVSGC